MKNQHTELQPFRKTHRASKPKTSEKGRSPACLHYEQPPERPNRKQITARRDGLDVFFAHPSGSVVPNVKLWGKRHPTKITKTNHPEGNWKTTLVQNPMSHVLEVIRWYWRVLKYTGDIDIICYRHIICIFTSSLRKKPSTEHVEFQISWKPILQQLPGFSKTPNPSDFITRISRSLPPPSKCPPPGDIFFLLETWVDETDLTG